MRHTPEKKAAVLSALLQGQSVSEAARTYKIPVYTCRRWLRELKRQGLSVGQERREDRIGELLADYLTANLIALQAQAEQFASKEWLAKQDAADVAVLHGVMTDKAVRLIEAFGRAGAEDAGAEDADAVERMADSTSASDPRSATGSYEDDRRV